MSLSTWDIPLALRPDEEQDCPSRLYLPVGSAYPGGSLGCTLDVAHTGCGVDRRHGNGLARWTDADAAQSLAELSATPPAGLRCTECPRPAVVAGLCQMCRGVEQAADDRIEAEA